MILINIKLCYLTQPVVVPAVVVPAVVLVFDVVFEGASPTEAGAAAGEDHLHPRLRVLVPAFWAGHGCHLTMSLTWDWTGNRDCKKSHLAIGIVVKRFWRFKVSHADDPVFFSRMSLQQMTRDFNFSSEYAFPLSGHVSS